MLFRKKDEKVYKIGTTGHNIFFLITGSAQTIISTQIATQSRIPVGTKGYDIQNTEKQLCGRMDHEPGAVFGDCTSVLGMQKEETLVAATNCLFLMLDANAVKKCCAPKEKEDLLHFADKKLNKTRNLYAEFLGKQHFDFQRISKIIGNNFKNSLTKFVAGKGNAPNRLG